jgi:hypothetical protein
MFTFGKDMPWLKFEESNEGNSLKNKSSIQLDTDGKLVFGVVVFAKLPFLDVFAIVLMIKKFKLDIQFYNLINKKMTKIIF